MALERRTGDRIIYGAAATAVVAFLFHQVLTRQSWGFFDLVFVGIAGGLVWVAGFLVGLELEKIYPIVRSPKKFFASITKRDLLAATAEIVLTVSAVFFGLWFFAMVIVEGAFGVPSTSEVAEDTGTPWFVIYLSEFVLFYFLYIKALKLLKAWWTKLGGNVVFRR